MEKWGDRKWGDDRKMEGQKKFQFPSFVFS